MRIIAGEWGGRRIVAPKGRDVRPTSDRAREAWMSIVHPDLAGARVLDLFAGTGALGIESLSRGAAHADFVERSARTARTLESNIASLGAGARSTVHVEEAMRFLGIVQRRMGDTAADAAPTPAYDVAFADPPWRKGHAVAVADAWLRQPFARILGVEHEATVSLPAGGDTRRYGDTAVTFYRTQR